MRARPNILSILIVCLVVFNPISLKAQDPSALTFEGHLRVLAVDDIDRTTGERQTRFVLYLNTDDGKLYEIEDPQRIQNIKASDRISLRGVKKNNKIIIDQIISREFPLIPPSEGNMIATESLPDTIGEQKTLVALLGFQDNTTRPFTLQQVKDLMLNNQDSANKFLMENSYGKMWLTPDFIDWLTLPTDSSQYNNTAIMMNTLDSIADLKQYSRFVFFFNEIYCGVGTVGKWEFNTPRAGFFSASVAYIGPPCVENDVIVHELGHNFGFMHASSINTVPQSLVDVGFFNDYGDDGDCMGGSGGNYNYYSSVWKTKAQWIERSQIQDVTASGEYPLDQIELPSTAVKVLRIPLGKDRDGNDFHYWIEYKKGIGNFGKDKEMVQIRTNPVAYSSTIKWWEHNSVRYYLFDWGGSISGRVTREEDGSGLEDFQVWICQPDPDGVNWDSFGYVLTDSHGDYWVNGITEGTSYIEVRSKDGYAAEYYDDVPASTGNRKFAKPINVTKNEDTLNINFALAKGGSISGRVTRESDGILLSGIHMGVSDSNFGLVQTDTSSSGAYRFDGLAGGDYYVDAWDNLGYSNEFYNNVVGDNWPPVGATSVRVVSGMDTPGIDFSLKEKMGSAVRLITNASENLAVKGNLISNLEQRMDTLNRYDRHELERGIPLSYSLGSIMPNDFQNIDISAPFYDPFRGVKVELIEKTGSGVDSKVRLRVTLSGVDISPGEVYNFGDVVLLMEQAASVTVTNNSGNPLTIGTLFVSGRNNKCFRVTSDNCSNRTLLRNEVCTSAILFSPDTEGNKFAVLFVPTDNPIRPDATVSLSGSGITETISSPNTPSGQSSGWTGVSYSYSSGGATSNLGHALEYQFDWKGDGITDVSTWGAAARTKQWSDSGTYYVRAKARCSVDHVESGWSSALPVIIKLNGPDLSANLTNGVIQTCTTKKGTGNIQCTLKGVPGGALYVQNIGNMKSSPSTVTFYLSQDSTFSDDDQFLKSARVGAKKPGRGQAISFSGRYRLPLNSTATGKYIIAVVVSPGDINTSNNYVIIGPLQ